MSVISKEEKKYINSLLEAGQESIVLDFKREWYAIFLELANKDKNKWGKGIFEFIKDCIAFLNLDIELDRYIIIGVQEDKKNKKFNVCGTEEKIYENDIQELIKAYIQPIPIIDIFMGYKYMDKKLDIIKIRKENKDRPYFFKKSVKRGDYNKECSNVGFIRHGSSTDQLTRDEIVKIFLSKNQSIYSYFNVSANVDYNHIDNIMTFIDIMDKIVNKESLDVISNSNNIFKRHFNEVFKNMILEGNIFGEKKDYNDYVCELIQKNKTNFSSLQARLDGGEYSLIVTIMVACYLIYKIHEQQYFMYKIENEKIIINFDGNNSEIDNNKYNEIKSIVNDFKQIILYLNNNKQYHYYLDILKVSEIEFSQDISELFILGDVRFKISEDVISLLMQPLYERSDKEKVAIRELLQNSIDACKKRHKNNNQGRITIEFKKEGEKSYLEFSDNGIGMDLSDIQNYYLTVGKSNKSDDSLALIGKYGIGALTVFLIGNNSEIRTKKCDDDEYIFKLFENSMKTDNLKRIKIISNENQSYTNIKIELKDEFNMDNINDIDVLVKNIGLDKYAINSDMIIKIVYKDQDVQLPSIGSFIHKYFLKLNNSKANCWIFYGDKAEMLYDEENFDKKNIKSVLKIISQKNVILYNNMMTKVGYDFMNYKHLVDNMPLLVVEGRLSEDEYATELSREQGKIKGIVLKELAEIIYKNEINKLIKFLQDDEDESFPLIKRKKIISFFEERFKLPSLLISKNKVIIAKSNSINNIKKYNKIFTIYSNHIEDKHIDYKGNEYYFLEKGVYSKSSIADIVEYNRMVCMSTKYLRQYILNATGSRNGFRKEQLKQLLRDIYPNESWDLELEELWKKIITNRKAIEYEINKNSKNDIYYFTKYRNMNLFTKYASEIGVIVIENITSNVNWADNMFCSFYEAYIQEIENKEVAATLEE